MTETSPFDAPPAAPRPANGIFFNGSEGAFWRLLTRGAVLLLVTLGIYRFWLQTEVRRFLWNNTEIAGDSLEYIGTARELLLGFLVAIAFLVPLYAAFQLGTFAAGWIGPSISLISLVVLGVLGQFAVYRARRYRLSRTVYRGIRFHQTGSAWRYAICAIFWWGMIGMTLGLAYPWAQASLERFKMRNTWYGDLRGQFTGSGTRLFFRGILLWLLVVGPFLIGVMVAIGGVDWSALSEALSRGGTDGMSRAEAAGAAWGGIFVGFSILWSMVAIAAVYPAFQAMVLRWWISGLRFGELTAVSHLRTSAVYGLYWRFVWISMLAGLVLAVPAAIVVGIFKLEAGGKAPVELLQVALGIGVYVIAALAYSTIYQATVKLRFWQRGFESAELSNVDVLDRVRAAPATGSPVGEGFADALHVGGI